MDKEIQTDFDMKDTCGEVMCTKCGLRTEDFRNERIVCDDIATRVESKVFPVSKHIACWKDVMSKLARLYCLNKFETESGFEPDDEILERNEDYCLLRDKRGLLLIVVHDQDSQNLIEKQKEQPQVILL